MKIAIIGSGISGLSTALLLSQKHDITIFEIDKRFGGHANTVQVKNKKATINRENIIDSSLLKILFKSLFI